MRSFQIGRPFGFPLKVNLSFLLLLAAVWLWSGGAAGVALMVLAFASVVAHELGHALVARRLNVRIKEIELGFFGGAAKMLDLPRSPRDEIAIAAAGPAVSFLVSATSYVASFAIGGEASSLLGLVAMVNLGIGLFNLVPALPMDGGRILRALLSMRIGHLRATEGAVKIARVFAVGLAAVGIVGLHLHLVVLAGLVWMMGTAELKMVRAQYARGQYSGFVGDEDEPLSVQYIPPASRPERIDKGTMPSPDGPVRVFVFRT